MPRATNNPAARARRKKVLKQAKGYWGRRKNVFTVAKNAVDKGMLYSYRDRKVSFDAENNHNKTIVIDPVFKWNRIYGQGVAYDRPSGVSADKFGNTYLTGITQSTYGIATQVLIEL